MCVPDSFVFQTTSRDVPVLLRASDLVHETDLHAQGIAQHSEAPLLELKDSLKTVKQV